MARSLNCLDPGTLKLKKYHNRATKSVVFNMLTFSALIILTYAKLCDSIKVYVCVIDAFVGNLNP